MGKRAVATPVDLQQQQQPCKRSTATRSIRKRKRNAGVEAAALATGAANAAQHTAAAAAATKTQRMSASSAASAPYWHENDDEDSSSNDIAGTPQQPPPQRPVARQAKNHSNKQANNSSILLNSSLNNSLMADSKVLMESPKPVYTLHPSLVNGTILHDVMKKPWRLGRPIGKGNFGEIFLASDNINGPVTNENAKFVVKIEPHSNGPLFVEIHCLINTAKKTATGASESDSHSRQSVSDSQKQPLLHPPTGIPTYIASGSHYFGDARYRFLVLQRFDRDLHSLIRNCRVHQKSVLTLAVQIVNVLESLHNKGYCHNDIKAQNLMISKCKFYKAEPEASAPRAASAVSKSLNKKFEEHYEEKQQTTDSGNSSEQETNNEEEFSDFACKQRHAAVHVKHEDAEDEDEDFDDGATSNSTNSNSMDNYKTPSQQSSRQQRQRKPFVEFSGSNPVRSCRRQKRNFMYEEMVKSHYLRPTKRVSYAEFFNEDGLSLHSETASNAPSSDDDESDEFHPNARRPKKTPKTSRSKRQTAKSAARKGSPKWPATSQSGQGAAAAAPPAPELLEEERIFLIDYGLASKFMDNGVHRPFVMDQRRAHDGTLEFTSRDAHMGAHSRRSDLESLGYNLLFWSQGYLPWKEAASQHQQERVHQAKEYLMADVREMLPLIYGKQVPKYLGEFLHLVGQLAYHERPDYAHYRRIFEKEFQQLGYKLAELRLNSREMSATCVQVNEEIENKNDIFEMSKHTHNAVVAGIFRSGGIGVGFDVSGTPFHERSLTNRVSPKNLRSKSDKKLLKKNKFSWAEILSQDPDQIARERAEKEYDREPDTSEEQVVRRYEGRPTYAILEIQRLTGRLVDDGAQGDEDANEEEDAEMYEMASGDEEEDEEEEEVDEAEEEEIASNEEEEDEEEDEEEAEVEEEYDEEEEEVEEQVEEEQLDEEEEEEDEEDIIDEENEEEADYCRDEEVAEEEEEVAREEEVVPRRQRGAPKGASRKGTSSASSSTTTTTTTKSSSRSSSRAVKRKSFGLRSKSRKQQQASVTFETSTTTTTVKSSSVKRSKRGRNGVVAMASAAGEMEHQYNGTAKTVTQSSSTVRARYAEHMQQHLPPTSSQHNRLGPGERRTRRGGPKTDAAAAADLMANDDESADSVDSRSSGRQHASATATNVSGLYNVWNQMHKESSATAAYYRSTATTTMTTTVSVPRRHRK